jgi:cobalt-zinc-cadmium efflux system protein
MAHVHAPRDPANLDRAFLVGIGLNVAFVVVEVVFGALAHSTALFADAAHNSSDVLGLVLAWAATALARRAPSDRHTYGLRRSTVLAALANAVLLLAAVGAVAWEAVGRFHASTLPQGATMMWVAACGVLVNGASALLLWKRSHGDANARGAFLHLVADAAVSVGVVVAGAVVWRTGWTWVDPLTSIVISIVILFSTWSLLRDALHLALDGVPRDIDLASVRAHLAALPRVEDVHDLHVWAMSTTEVALTAHLVMPWNAEPPEFLSGLEHDLEHRFGITHTTVQIEPRSDSACAHGAPGSV